MRKAPRPDAPAGQASAPARPTFAAAVAAGLMALAACTTDDVMRPSVDVGTSTSAIAVRPAAEIAPPASLAPAVPLDPGPVPAASLPATGLADAQVPASPVLEAASPTVAPAPPLPATGLADARISVQPAPPAEPPAPVVVAAAAAPARGLQTLVPSNPYMVGFPRLNEPLSRPTAMPADEVDCRRQLKRLGVKYRDIAPIRDSASCRIDWPVEVSGLSGNIAMKPAATLSCQMALAFAGWTRNELAPAARTRYFSGVRTIHQGSSYSCRKIRGTRTVSEHAKGNALDVMRIELKNGRDIDVRKPGWFAFRQRGLLNNVRSDACGYFTTVLGPGYDADHKDHFHFDIKERRNGYRACR